MSVTRTAAWSPRPLAVTRRLVQHARTQEHAGDEAERIGRRLAWHLIADRYRSLFGQLPPMGQRSSQAMCSAILAERRRLIALDRSQGVLRDPLGPRFTPEALALTAGAQPPTGMLPAGVALGGQALAYVPVVEEEQHHHCVPCAQLARFPHGTVPATTAMFLARQHHAIQEAERRFSA